MSFKCPKCKSTKEFHIRCQQWVTASIDKNGETLEIDNEGSLAFEDDSVTICESCGCKDYLYKFEVAEDSI
jgi:hypothetical protein